MGPLVTTLESNYHKLVGTNHLLHQVSELVKEGGQPSCEFEALAEQVRVQLHLLGVHVNLIRDAPRHMNVFRQNTMQQMKSLEDGYSTAMRQAFVLMEHKKTSRRGKSHCEDYPKSHRKSKKSRKEKHEKKKLVRKYKRKYKGHRNSQKRRKERRLMHHKKKRHKRKESKDRRLMHHKKKRVRKYKMRKKKKHNPTSYQGK
jgi:hypothetical protein